jgi:hypothetical protein
MLEMAASNDHVPPFASIYFYCNGKNTINNIARCIEGSAKR